jgi:hypothetical protein
MATIGYLETVGFGEQGQFGIARVGNDLFVFFVPDIADALEEQQREDVGLEVSGIHRAAQDVGGFPQVGFKLA